jgi:vang-like
VKYAGSYVDSLLVLHYLALLLMELRHRQPIYLIRVIRYRDGEYK